MIQENPITTLKNPQYEETRIDRHGRCQFHACVISVATLGGPDHGSGESGKMPNYA
jgi:hypothetical protein